MPALPRKRSSTASTTGQRGSAPTRICACRTPASGPVQAIIRIILWSGTRGGPWPRHQKPPTQSYCVNPKVAVKVTKVRQIFVKHSKCCARWQDAIPNLVWPWVLAVREKRLASGRRRSVCDVWAHPLNCLCRAKRRSRAWKIRARLVSAGAVSASPLVSPAYYSSFPLPNSGQGPAARVVGALSLCHPENFGHAHLEQASCYARRSERIGYPEPVPRPCGCSW